MFARFLANHGLIDPKSGRPIQRFCWCSDGPFDIRDFVVKQCFISKVSCLRRSTWINEKFDRSHCLVINYQMPMPLWLKGDILDVRKVVSVWAVASSNPDTTVKVPINFRRCGLTFTHDSFISLRHVLTFDHWTYHSSCKSSGCQRFKAVCTAVLTSVLDFTCNSALLIFFFTLSFSPTGHTEHRTCDDWACSSWSPFGTQNIHQSKSSLELDGKVWGGSRAHTLMSQW